MNPDSLREEAESLRTDPRGLGMYAGRVRAHADAWEADIFKRWQVDQLVLAKQDRIEELEADNAALRDGIRGEIERLRESLPPILRFASRPKTSEIIAAVEADMHTTDGTTADDRSKEE